MGERRGREKGDRDRKKEKKDSIGALNGG